MASMTRDEIVHLASLSRIRLTDTEIEALNEDLTSILDYVSQVTKIVAESTDTNPAVGAVFNVMREDEVTNEPESYTETLLEQMPGRQGRFMKVKKIIAQDE